MSGAVLHFGRIVRLGACVLMVVGWLQTAAARADDAAVRFAPIPFEDDNGLVRFPVTLGGRELSFVLATGTTLSEIDSRYSDELGPKIGITEVQGGFGNASKMALHFCPPLIIGGQDPGIKKVNCESLEELSAHTDRAVDGQLGMDFLRTRVVQIDWGNKQLRLSAELAEQPSPTDVMLEISDSLPGIPCVVGRVNDKRDIKFWAATTAGGQAILVRRDNEGLVDDTTPRLAMPDPGGRIVGHLLRLGDLELGGGHHRDAVCTLLVGGGNCSAGGCDFWKQYRVTFDFPGKRIYLRKRENIAPDEASMTGLAFTRYAQSKLVRFVFADSPAAKAGILKGDRLVRLDGRAADGIRLSEVRAAQKSGVGKKIEMEFDRDGQRIRANIILRRLL